MKEEIKGERTYRAGCRKTESDSKVETRGTFEVKETSTVEQSINVIIVKLFDERTGRRHILLAVLDRRLRA
jgi:hypothetical protein